jgi:nucleotide-binding universal stress UspA family protein
MRLCSAGASIETLEVASVGVGRRRCEKMAVIVVGVDGSKESKDALRFALEEARFRQASVHVVHAEHHYAGEEERARWLDGIVREVAGESPGVEILQSIVDGGAPHVLVEAAKEAEAEMLVVGSRGHGGFTGLLLGSVGQQCAHHATCPLAIVR